MRVCTRCATHSCHSRLESACCCFFAFVELAAPRLMSEILQKLRVFQIEWICKMQLQNDVGQKARVPLAVRAAGVPSVLLWPCCPILFISTSSPACRDGSPVLRPPCRQLRGRR